MTGNWWESTNELVTRIKNLHQAYLLLRDGATKAIADGVEFKSIRELEDYAARIQFGVWIRGDWHAPGYARISGPIEYEIVLSNLNPAIHLVGDLDDYGKPTSVRVEVLDVLGSGAPDVPRGYGWRQWDIVDAWVPPAEERAMREGLWWFVRLFKFVA